MIRVECPEFLVSNANTHAARTRMGTQGARTRAARLTASFELGAQSARSQASREKGTVNMPPPDEQFEGLQEMPRSELEERIEDRSDRRAPGTGAPRSCTR